MSIDGTNLYDDVEEMQEAIAEEGARRFLNYAEKYRDKKEKKREADATKKNPEKAKGTTGEGKDKGVDAGTSDNDSGVNGEKDGSIESGKSSKEKSIGTINQNVHKALKKVKIGALALGAILGCSLLTVTLFNLSDDIPQVIIDTPYDTGFRIDDTTPADALSENEYEAYENSRRAIEMGIKLAQERAIKDFLKDIERKGWDKEETLKHTDFTALEQVTYEPILINAVYAVMMRQEGCTLQDLCDTLAENLEFNYTLSGPQKMEKTQLFEYRGVVHYKGFNAWEWRERYNPLTGETIRYLEQVYIDNRETIKYGSAEFQPLKREDFYLALGYDEDKLGDKYYAEPLKINFTGWNWLDKIIDRRFQLGVYSETPHRETYFDAIMSMTESTELYLFDTVGGQSADYYFSPLGYTSFSDSLFASVKLQTDMASLALTVGGLEIVEVKDKEIYYDKKEKKHMRSLSAIPGELTNETRAEMYEKAVECVSIASSVSGGLISNKDRMTLQNNLKDLRENALCLKLKDKDRETILKITRETLEMFMDTLVSSTSEQFDEVEEANEKNAYRKPSSYHEQAPDCGPSSGG